MSGQIHENDIGTSFEVTLLDADGNPVDITSALTKELVFMSPLTVRKQKTAAFVTDGSDGKLKYVTQSGDLDAVGPWKLQAVISLVTGTWSSDIHRFTVHENLGPGV